MPPTKQEAKTKPKKEVIVITPVPLKEKISNIQNEIGAIEKDALNEFANNHRYFDINTLIGRLQPVLFKYRVVLTQPIEEGVLISRLRDLDSESVEESSLPLDQALTPQQKGGEITYFRRYTLASLLALQAEDDDGNSASKTPKKGKVPKGEKQPESKRPAVQELADEQKSWLPEKGIAFNKVQKAIHQDGYTIKEIRLRWKINKEVAKLLEAKPE